jgi:hypothetical protein
MHDKINEPIIFVDFDEHDFIEARLVHSLRFFSRSAASMGADGANVFSTMC